MDFLVSDAVGYRELCQLLTGLVISRDLAKAIDRLQDRLGWVDRFMQVMAINLPKTVLWGKIKSLRRVLPKSS